MYDETDPGGETVVVAGEMQERTAAAAARLAALGLAPGDLVVWSAASSADALVANVAALRAGLVVVPANPAYTGAELGRLVDDARPAAAVLDDPRRAAIVLARPHPPTVVVTTRLEVIAGAPGDAAALQLDAAEPAAPALVGYTSGTTGAPKGAVLDHRALLAGAEALRLAWRWGPDELLVTRCPCSTPTGCASASTAGSSPAAVSGCCLASTRRLLQTSSAGALDVLGSDDVPPPRRRTGAAALGRLRLAVSGSAPLSAALHEAVRRIACGRPCSSATA